MRRLRPHRTSAVVLIVLVVASYAASSTARRAVEDNEAQLLLDRTAEVQNLLESLGSGFAIQLASVAAIAEVTEGDAEQFRRAVLGVSPEAETGGAGWSLLRRTATGYEQVAALGQVTPASEFSPEFVTGLAELDGQGFAVLGFLGAGPARRFAIAGGSPSGGDYRVYSEFGVFAALATTASTGEESDANPIAGLAVEVFVGTKPDPSQLLFALGIPDESHQVRRVVEISGAEVFLEVSPTVPLGGSLALALPNLLLIGGSLLGLSIGGVIEMMQRRRDDAVAAVRDLERQNAKLDKALLDQQVTEEARAALEGELRQAQRLEAIGHLAGGVAHDFNNVLAAILSYADLASDGVTDPSVRADLESIQHAARRGAELTRKLLQFSRRRAGEVSLVDVNERVADVAVMLGRTLGEDVTLRTALVAHPATTLVDPVELDQVLLNLVVNARDAVSPGGTIVVSTDLVELSGDPEGAAEVAITSYVRLTVTDDGCGMTPEILEHAFDPFFTSKGRGEGTGLGLSTVYGIVQRSGGHLLVHSTPGEGTAIEVFLPAESDFVTPAPEAEDRPPATVGNGRTVLLVEDEADLRSAVRRMLERSGFFVIEAEDGAAAIDRKGTDRIDLLLTDVVMPKGVTGADVCAAFRTRDATLPVVFMTGYSDDILDAGSLDGITMLLPKPFSEPELLGALGAVLGANV